MLACRGWCNRELADVACNMVEIGCVENEHWSWNVVRVVLEDVGGRINSLQDRHILTED